MRKLFLSLFAAFLIYFSAQSVSAATYTFHMSKGTNDSGYSISSPTDLYVNVDAVVSAYKDSHNEAHVIVNHIPSDSSFWGSNASNSRRDVHFVGYTTQRMYFYCNSAFTSLGDNLWTVTLNPGATVSGVTASSAPFFNNQTDAKNYALGLSYNPDNVIGGSIPYQNTFSSDRLYQPYINFADVYYGYEDFFGININGLTTILDMQLRELAQVPNYTNSRVQLVYYVPTSLAMDTFIADYDMGSGIFMASSIETFMKEHPDFRYNNNLTYESHAISKNVDFSSSTRFTDTISDYSVWGNQEDLLYNQLLSIYDNSAQKALYAYLLLMRYDYVSVAHYSDNTSMKVRTVYPAGFYYFNLYNYDNTLYKKRGVPVSPSVGTGSSSPTYDNPQNPNNYTGISDSITDSLQQQLTQSINDSHDSNTVINNYYQGLDQRIDQFEDGTLNIDDTISNVISVAKSVSHIGLIFGYLFNGFLPAEVITLLGFAFVLIPIVVIIKLIRG